MRKITYKTKHMEELQEYMQSITGSHVTVNDVSQYFANTGINVGTATIYRNLERLVEDGMVLKYSIDGTSSACYEYVGGEAHHSESSCYHCKCESCGKIIHLTCDEIRELGEHMLKHHGFTVDYHRTVFYGTCEACRQKREEEGSH